MKYEEFPVGEWQKLASPCWMDIKQSNTLNKKLAREDDDERHIAPLQLDLIHRCLRLWSAKDDVVFSPFTGIGSEGYMALQLGRKFIGAELKESYYRVAANNLKQAESLAIPEFTTIDEITSIETPIYFERDENQIEMFQ